MYVPRGHYFLRWVAPPGLTPPLPAHAPQPWSGGGAAEAGQGGEHERKIVRHEMDIATENRTQTGQHIAERT